MRHDFDANIPEGKQALMWKELGKSKKMCLEHAKINAWQL